MKVKNKQYIFGIVAIALLFFVGRFVYNNIIAPWPYREELQSCLESARAQENEDIRKSEENICFRTYPHFN